MLVVFTPVVKSLSTHAKKTHSVLSQAVCVYEDPDRKNLTFVSYVGSAW